VFFSARRIATLASTAADAVGLLELVQVFGPQHPAVDAERRGAAQKRRRTAGAGGHRQDGRAEEVLAPDVHDQPLHRRRKGLQELRHQVRQTFFP
jgi:hypothetical protein